MVCLSPCLCYGFDFVNCHGEYHQRGTKKEIPACVARRHVSNLQLLDVQGTGLLRAFVQCPGSAGLLSLPPIGLGRAWGLPLGPHQDRPGDFAGAKQTWPWQGTTPGSCTLMSLSMCWSLSLSLYLYLSLIQNKPELGKDQHTRIMYSKKVDRSSLMKNSRATLSWLGPKKSTHYIYIKWKTNNCNLACHQPSMDKGLFSCVRGLMLTQSFLFAAGIQPWWFFSTCYVIGFFTQAFHWALFLGGAFSNCRETSSTKIHLGS